MNLFENDTENVADELESENMEQAEMPEIETDALLKKLEEVLEITDGEKPDAAASTEESAEKAPAEQKNEKPALQEKPSSFQDETIPAASFVPKARPAANAGQEPTARFSMDTVDDENLIAELHALIGDPFKPKPAAGRSNSPASVTPAPRTAPAPRPVARITPDALKDVPEDYEDVAEADTLGVPGWLKGLFILLISLLLGAMTFYAVASDVIGEIF